MLSKTRSALLSASLFLAVSAASSEALAFESYTVGGGLIGVIGGQFMNKPGDRTVPGAGGAQDTSYPGFGGFNGPGGGFFIEGRVLGIVGLEIDFLRTSDRAHGDITINGSNVFKVDVGQNAWHIPVLVKATLPSPLFAPSIMAGPEFVRTDASTVEISPVGLQGITAKADNYTMFTVGIGGEFKLPLPVVDIRIPFSLRGSVQPGFSDGLSDRVKYSGPASNPYQNREINTAWRYQAQATLGVAAHF